MNYRQEKEKAAAKGRKIKAIILAIVVFLTAGLCIFSAFYPASTWKYYVGLPDVPKRKEGELRIHFLDVGQGDCTLIEFPDGRTMMIDGGDGKAEHTKTILRYINALKIDTLDFLLLTHSDSDHCGGFAEIMEIKGAKTVYIPEIKDVNINREYAEFYASVVESDARMIYSERYLRIFSEEEYPYSLVFLSPYRAGNPGGSPYDKVNGGDYTENDLNDTSAVVWLDYFGTSALFCGDATSRIEETLIRDAELNFFEDYGVRLDSTEILKVSHHGSATGTGEEFVRYLGLETAVISCGENNFYGHPDAGVCERLSEAGAEIYRPDLLGTIMISVFPDGTYSATI